ncbi:MAG: hypothetical protein IBX55_01055 [Methyloprofundus sp.]|nr:hypothetical protein [Methyloprofundus sp.]
MNSTEANEALKKLGEHAKKVILYLSGIDCASLSDIGFATCKFKRDSSRIKPQGAAIACSSTIGSLKDIGVVTSCDTGFKLSPKGKALANHLARDKALDELA